MFCLIWLLGGGPAGPEEGAVEAAGWEGLEEEWFDGAEEAVADEPLEEDEEEWLLDGGSFCIGCFLGMVKLDLVTLSAPVMWTGPAGNEEGVEAEGAPGLLDFAVGLPAGVACLLVDLELA